MVVYNALLVSLVAGVLEPRAAFGWLRARKWIAYRNHLERRKDDMKWS